MLIKCFSWFVGSSSCGSALMQTPRVTLQQTRNKYKRFPMHTKIKYSRETGGAETYQPVIDRFYRLNNGLWIRTRGGKRTQGRYKLSKIEQVRLDDHVFCNRQQSEMLDKFLEEEYLRPHHFPDDPYNVYHKKSNVLGYKYTPKRFYP